jgi:hypothetical protein
LTIIIDKLNIKKINKEVKKNKRFQGLKEYKDNILNLLKKEKDIYRSRVEDKLEEPKRDYQNSSGLPINIRTRGRELPYQMIGFLYRDETDLNYNKDDVNRLILFGRPKWSGSNKYEYYVTTNENSSIKIEIEDDNDELYDGDTIDVTGFAGSFKVKLYGYKEMKYIPFI